MVKRPDGPIVLFAGYDKNVPEIPRGSVARSPAPVALCHAPEGATNKKEVFIIADGMPADMIEKINPPHLQTIIQIGAYHRLYVGGVLGSYNQTPTISAAIFSSWQDNRTKLVGDPQRQASSAGNKKNSPAALFNGSLKPYAFGGPIAGIRCHLSDGRKTSGIRTPFHNKMREVD